MKRKLVAVLIPILALLILVFYKHHIIQNGKEFTLKIDGFDPRDLLAGHYVTYRINYEDRDICIKRKYVNRENVRLCLDSSCVFFLSGRCKNSQFIAGIERFYIPESRARSLDKALRESRGKLVISVMPKTSKVVVKDLLIDDLSFKENFKNKREDPK